MGFLRKMLLVVIVMISIGNAEEMIVANGIINALPPAPVVPFAPQASGNPILDFNTISTIGSQVFASLQPKLYRNPIIGAPDRACVYFTVMNNGNPNNANTPFQNATIVDPDPKNECNVYFPQDGHQPTTKEAGIYSCANIADDNITDWYIRAFGGDEALEYSKNEIPKKPPYTVQKLGAKKLTSKQMIETYESSRDYPKGKKILKSQNCAEHIITVNGDDDVFKKSFWKTFRVIASDPVGRVLLYRLIIEIRRCFSTEFIYNFLIYEPSVIVESSTGAIEKKEDINIAFGLYSLGTRNNCRSITINKSDGNSFSLSEQCINFSDAEDITTSVLKIEGNSIKTEEVKRTADIGLFHEMLHWFHYLRDYDRYNKDRSFDGLYCHLMMCYYGNDKLRELYNDYNELFA